MSQFGLLLLCVFMIGVVCSWSLAHFLIYRALKNNIVDIPNHRSSHTKITPRGGGLAFVILSLLLLLFLLIHDWVYGGITALPMNGLVLPLFLSSAMIAGIGYLDDRFQLTARIRIIIHFLAAALIVVCLGYIKTLELFSLTLPLYFVGALLTVFFLIWLTNLYNFMDGIDGLAAIEGIFVLTALMVLMSYWFAYYDASSLFTHSYTFVVIFPLVSFIVGFLLVNFPPAKIFMGDAGSGFLGFVLAVLILFCTNNIHVDFLWCGLILLGVFIVDATWTLLMRLLKKQRVFEAHRTHAYQYASRKYRSHLLVSIAVLMVNCVWLFPLAFLVLTQKIDGFLGLIIAYAPLMGLCLYYRAGIPEKTNKS